MDSKAPTKEANGQHCGLPKDSGHQQVSPEAAQQDTITGNTGAHQPSVGENMVDMYVPEKGTWGKISPSMLDWEEKIELGNLEILKDMGLPCVHFISYPGEVTGGQEVEEGTEESDDQDSASELSDDSVAIESEEELSPPFSPIIDVASILEGRALTPPPAQTTQNEDPIDQEISSELEQGFVLEPQFQEDEKDDHDIPIDLEEKFAVELQNEDSLMEVDDESVSEESEDKLSPPYSPIIDVVTISEDEALTPNQEPIIQEVSSELEPGFLLEPQFQEVETDEQEVPNDLEENVADEPRNEDSSMDLNDEPLPLERMITRSVTIKTMKNKLDEIKTRQAANPGKKLARVKTRSVTKEESKQDAMKTRSVTNKENENKPDKMKTRSATMEQKKKELKREAPEPVLNRATTSTKRSKPVGSPKKGAQSSIIIVSRRGRTSYKCSFCSGVFSTGGICRRHIKCKHSTGRPFKCQDCGKSFNRGDSLKHHVDRIHRGLKPHKCDQCEWAFQTPWELKHHIRSHTGERRFQCSICEKLLSTSFTLRNHHLFVHLRKRPVSCIKCSKTFQMQKDVNRHLKTCKGIKNKTKTKKIGGARKSLK